ncbi:MAG: DsbA family protein [Acidobacteriota bacterium]
MIALRRSLHALSAPLLVLGLAGFEATTTQADDDRVTDIARIKDVDFGGLSEEQKRLALKIMNEHGCNCGCDLTIAQCRDRDQSCRRSLIFARTILDTIREGRGEAEVVKVLKAKADTFVEARLPDDAGVIYDIDTTRNPVRGRPDAPVVIVEFSDFQCPYCAGVQGTLEAILKAFPDEVRLVYKQYPLNIHQYARQAAAASLAAHAEGKFWEMHDKLFQNYTAINEENIKRWADEIGLDMQAFEKAMLTGKYEAAVQKDIADGTGAKVLGTPTLFVNGKRVRDRSFEGFKRMIQEALAAARAWSPPEKTAAGGGD